MNYEYEAARRKLEGLSNLGVRYYEPAGEGLGEGFPDPVVYKLSGGDLVKGKEIEEMWVEECYNWLYLVRVQELNEMRLRICEWEKLVRQWTD